jgi:peptidoglycan/LPS O-acetylase OafA/YrhL
LFPKALGFDSTGAWITVVRAKMTELDSLRGITRLLVLFYHGFAFRYFPEHMSVLERAFSEHKLNIQE